MLLCPFSAAQRWGRDGHHFYVAFDQIKKRKEKFSGQQVGAAESKTKTKRKEEQFQLTYAKVKVISIKKRPNREKSETFLVSLLNYERLRRNRGGLIFHPAV